MVKCVTDCLNNDADVNDDVGDGLYRMNAVSTMSGASHRWCSPFSWPS